jgi:hypothetical protein
MAEINEDFPPAFFESRDPGFESYFLMHNIMQLYTFVWLSYARTREIYSIRKYNATLYECSRDRQPIACIMIP